MLKTIAIDLTPVLPGGENGGAKIFTLELIRRLSDLQPATQFILLTHVSSHEELSDLDRPNIHRLMVVGTKEVLRSRDRFLSLGSRLVSYLPGRLHRGLRKFYRLIKTDLSVKNAGSLLKDLGADFLFCPFTAPTYSEDGIPTVCTIYDLQYKTYPQFFTEEEVIQRDATFINACHKATALAAISNYSRASAILKGNLDPEKIRTIHLRLATRVSHNEAISTNILSTIGISPQRYLIYPANFWKHKNHEMLLTAFSLACNGGLDPDIKLVCTGAPGERKLWLEAVANSMNLDGRILFPGFVSHAELSELIAKSKGLIFPSLYEGFGIPIVEAMAAGVPIACSNTTSLPEVAGNAAILFDPRIPEQIVKAIIALVENHNLCSELVQCGHLRAKGFSDMEQMAKEYWDLFLFASTREQYGRH